MRSSSAMTSEQRRAIHANLAPTVRKSRLRMHSPQRHPAHVVIPRKRQLSATLKCTVCPTDRASLRAALKSHARCHVPAGNPRESVRPFGKHKFVVTSGRGHICWIGPALVIVGAQSWSLGDVVAPCRVVVNYVRHDGIPARHVHTHATPVARDARAHPPSRGAVHSVEVQPLVGCFHKTDVRGQHDTRPKLDDELVRHWSPMTKLIYATCDAASDASAVLAKVTSLGTYRCLYCRADFGHCISGLISHLGLPPTTEFKTHHVDQDRVIQ